MQKPNVVGVTKVDILTSPTAIPTVFIIVLIPGLVSFSEVCKKKKKTLRLSKPGEWKIWHWLVKSDMSVASRPVSVLKS